MSQKVYNHSMLKNVCFRSNDSIHNDCDTTA